MKETRDDDTTVQFTLEGFIPSTESSELWDFCELCCVADKADIKCPTFRVFTKLPLTGAIISHTWLLFSVKVFDDRVLTPAYEDNVFDISVNN